MPIKRRIGKAKNDYEIWRNTLGTGTDWFGELPDEYIETFLHCGSGGDPHIHPVAEAWQRHGARLLAETAATPGCVGNGSVWALWVFGPPENVDPIVLSANVEQMKADWDDEPGWPDREKSENWRRQHRQRLAKEAASTGTIPDWVADNFPDLLKLVAP